MGKMKGGSQYELFCFPPVETWLRFSEVLQQYQGEHWPFRALLLCSCDQLVS